LNGELKIIALILWQINVLISNMIYNLFLYARVQKEKEEEKNLLKIIISIIYFVLSIIYLYDISIIYLNFLNNNIYILCNYIFILRFERGIIYFGKACLISI